MHFTDSRLRIIRIIISKYIYEILCEKHLWWVIKNYSFRDSIRSTDVSTTQVHTMHMHLVDKKGFAFLPKEKTRANRLSQIAQWD